MSNSQETLDLSKHGIHIGHVYLMLSGLAIECLIKHIYNKRNIKIAYTHNLTKLLSNLALHDVLEGYKSILNKLSDAIIFSGRYPEPKKIEKYKFKTTDENGNTIHVTKSYFGFTTEYPNTIEKLILRLKNEVNI